MSFYINILYEQIRRRDLGAIRLLQRRRSNTYRDKRSGSRTRTTSDQPVGVWSMPKTPHIKRGRASMSFHPCQYIEYVIHVHHTMDIIWEQESGEFNWMKKKSCHTYRGWVIKTPRDRSIVNPNYFETIAHHTTLWRWWPFSKKAPCQEKRESWRLQPLQKFHMNMFQNHMWSHVITRVIMCDFGTCSCGIFGREIMLKVGNCAQKRTTYMTLNLGKLWKYLSVTSAM